MIKRTLVGVPLVGMIFLFLYLTSLGVGYTRFLPIDLLIVVFAWIGTYEMYNVTRKAGYLPIAIPIILCALAIYPVTIFGFKASYVGVLYCILVSLLIAFVFFIFRTKHSLNDFIMTAFIMTYPLALTLMYTLLNHQYGVIPMLLAIASGLMSDTLAYFTGSIIKGPKIFPKISPKKTYSGCIGGLIGGALGGLIIYAIFEVALFPANTPFKFTTAVSILGYPINPYLIYCVLGFLCAFFAEIGDLAASKIKRELKIKDYGTIIAGHGGVMDRLDSLMFTMVPLSIFMYIFYPLL